MLSIQMHHHWAFELPYGCRSLFALNVMDFDYFIIIVVWCIASKCNVRDVGQTVVSQPVNSTQLSFDSKIGENRECFGLFFSFFFLCSKPRIYMNQRIQNEGKKTAVTWLLTECLSGNAMNGCFLTICSDHIRLRELTNCFDSDLWMICSGNCTSYIGLSCDMYAFINCNSLEINCWQ